MDSDDFFVDQNDELKQQNRFIFSDDFYENMPLESQNKLDVSQKVKPYINRNEVYKTESLQSQVINQTNDFNKMVSDDYSDPIVFNYFEHNVNTELPIEEANIPIVSEVKIDDVEEYNNKNKHSIFNKRNNEFLHSIENIIFQNKNEPDNVVHLDKPLVEEDKFKIDIIPHYNQVNEYDKGLGYVGDSEQVRVESVDTIGVSDNLIDSIVDYQEIVKKREESSISQSNQYAVDSNNKKVVSTEVEIPDNSFMQKSQKSNNLEIETGINYELERELIRQKQLEEEERLKDNPEHQNYLKQKEEDSDTEFLYRASGKSVIRKKTPKHLVSKIPVRFFKEGELLDDKAQAVDVIEKLEDKPQEIQDIIEDILDIPNLDEISVPINPVANPGFVRDVDKLEDEPVVSEQITTVYDEKKDNFNYDQNFENIEVKKSDLLDRLKEESDKEGKISILARYGEDFCSKDYITNPSIGRAEEIKQLILILLTPEKSGILIGKPGIGKTSIVEGLAYQLQRNNVPDALKDYVIVSVKTASLLGTLPTGETRLQTLVDELKKLDKIILFIDEIHMLIGATSESSIDFANMFKESLGRGSIKVIGATTTEEYERYILRDKAFVRRFQKIEVEEPDKDHTVKILLGTLPKIEKTTGAKLKYTDFIKSEIMSFIVDITTEYKRIYGIGSRYPDICLTLLSQAFSQAVFANRKEVTIIDIRKAIENSKNIYPDVIKKELVNFDKKFKDVIKEELSN